MKYLFLMMLAIVMVFGCHQVGSSDGDAGPDADTDGDTDSDGDVDTDVDGDSDSDSDTDTGPDSDTDTDSDGEIWGNLTIEDAGPATAAQVTAMSTTTTAQYGPVNSDSSGDYIITGLPPDIYDLCAYQDVYAGEVFGVVVAEGASVEQDIDLTEMTAYAPYIYLYPEQGQNVSVTLLPNPVTSIVASDPTYGTGWNVWAEPTGLIDGMYDYLFYESTVIWNFQEAEGWVVNGTEIFDWFDDNLPLMGLNTSEVQDFSDYWSVNLPSAPCYYVFPQSVSIIDQNMGVSITPTPDSMLRFWLMVEGAPTCGVLATPSPVTFIRTGFTVVEWGVVLNWNTF